MEYKHTPGPWEYDGLYVESLDLDVPLSICTVADCGEATEINARLIAAAPELLEACQAALDWIRDTQPMEHGNPELGKVWGLLENSIEKAEG